MSPRLQRLATDWKIALAGLIAGAGAALTAATELVDKLAKAATGVANLPPAAKWLAAGLLAALSVLALVSALGRRSTLLRPERFVISADDPQHLVGRDEEVKALAKACEQNALVFLQGESGAGKSALVLGGLLPHYQATRAGTEAPRLLPIRIDASPLAWDKGLRIELARSLRDVSAEEQARLGATAPLGSGDPFSWLAALPVDAPCQVLLVLDQIDDYAVAHQARFVSDHTVVAPEQFEAANANWAAMGSLVRKGSIRLLIVCRADAAGILDALRFTRARTFLLPRIDQHLISPILDRVTQADEGAPVVADPKHGWLQLKAQLLRDLAGPAVARSCRCSSPSGSTRCGASASSPRPNTPRTAVCAAWDAFISSGTCTTRPGPRASETTRCSAGSGRPVRTPAPGTRTASGRRGPARPTPYRGSRRKEDPCSTSRSA